MMVNAHLSQMQDSGYVHAIFKTDIGFRVSSDINQKTFAVSSEAQEVALFTNRNMMVRILTGFLQQRKVALKNSSAGETAEKLYDMIYGNRQKDLQELMAIVAYQYPKFMRVAPAAASRWYKNYKIRIEPILNFCIGKNTDGG